MRDDRDWPYGRGRDGKIEAAKFFAEGGLPVIDTDELARELVEPGQPAMAEIRKAFGESVIDAHSWALQREIRDKRCKFAVMGRPYGIDLSNDSMKMSRPIRRLLLLLAFCSVCAQVVRSEMVAPSVQWQRSFGGNGIDLLRSVQQTPDGGYILAGYSNSATNGNKTSPHFGGWDFWLIRLDAQGNERWQKSFGGAADDSLEAVCLARDGGYLLGGHSASIDGTKTSTNYGGSDVWLIRLDADGNELWQQTFGGSGGEQLFSIDQTSDGGWILGGSSTSTNGNKTSPNWGDQDFWAIRLDSAGVKLWDQSCGGSLRDIAKHIRQTPDGGFLIGGHTLSGADGTKTSPRLGSVRDDFWLVRLDSEGRQLWDKEYLAPPRWPDWHASWQEMESIDQTPDGGFLLGGPATFFVPTQFNKTEFGVVRIDATGNELWSRCLARDDLAYPGGAHGDFLYSVNTLADTGFLLGGRSGSPYYQFAWDFSLLRVDENGDRLWDALYGGSQHEEMRSVRQTSDSGFIIGGYSTSEPGGNKTAPFYGGRDFWVLKLTPESPRLKALQPTETQLSFALFPGTTNHAYRIDHSTNLIDWTPITTNYQRTYKVEIGAPNPRTGTSFYRVERLL